MRDKILSPQLTKVKCRKLDAQCGADSSKRRFGCGSGKELAVELEDELMLHLRLRTTHGMDPGEKDALFAGVAILAMAQAAVSIVMTRYMFYGSLNGDAGRGGDRDAAFAPERQDADQQ